MAIKENDLLLWEATLKNALHDHFYNNKEFLELKDLYAIPKKHFFFKYSGFLKEKIMGETVFIVAELPQENFDLWLQGFVDLNKKNKAKSNG